MPLKRFFLFFLLSVFLCTAAAAQDSKPYNLTPYFGYHYFDHKRDYKDRPEFGILMERMIRKEVGLEAGLGGIHTKKASNDDSVSGLTYRLNGNYYPDQLKALDGKLIPYLTAGLGGDYLDRKFMTGIDAGLGLKYLISNDVAVRAEFREVFMFKGRDDYVALLGLSFPFGWAKKTAPADTDGDGVVDSLDKCPDTPKGVKVDKDGCPIDTDGDGVADYLDKCPDTPKGAKVDNVGCVVSITLKVNFDTGKSVVKDEFLPEIELFANFMKNNPDIKVEIQGHTDNVGNADANLKLSEDRAKAVMRVIVDKFGISENRITSKGYGMTKPIESNDTPEGRAKNRRVEAVVLK